MGMRSDVIVAQFDQLIVDANALYHINIRTGVQQNLQNMRQAIVDEMAKRSTNGQVSDLTEDEFTRYSGNCADLKRMITEMVAQDMCTAANRNAALLGAMQYAQNVSWASYWHRNGYWPY